MFRVLFIVVLLTHGANAATVYKCNTENGLVFSNQPCAADAEKLEIRTNSPPARQTATNAAPIDVAAFDGISARTPDQITREIGPPAATYVDDGTEHWLYPNACEINDRQQRVCVDLLIENDTPFQITWLPDEVMRKTVAVARGFEGWRPPEEVRDKPFTLEQTDLRGQSKAAVVARLGEPDVKKVFNGQEFWEYKRVPISRANPEKLVLYIEFEGDRVLQTIAN